MKVKFDIECTPEEARQFFGLPDVQPMQEKLMKDLQERLEENIRAVSAEELIRTWMPATMQGFGEMQKNFWSQMGMQAGTAKDDNKNKD